MKARIFVISMLSVLYCFAVFFMLNPESYEYYVDYYFFNNRIFSRQDEINFSKKTPQKSMELFKRYKFNDEPSPYFLQIGMSAPKGDGRWTLGNLAKIVIIAPKTSSNVLLRFKTSAFINTRNSEIIVTPKVGDKVLPEWKYQTGKQTPKTEILLRKEMLAKERRVEISFKIKGYTTPRELGYGADNEKLGLFLSEIELMPKQKI